MLGEDVTMLGGVRMPLYVDIYDVTCPQRVSSLLHFDFDFLEAL